MKPYFSQTGVGLYLGDAVEVMRKMPECSVDAVVTDPPAGISFMNLKFDSDRGGRKQWVAWLTEIMVEALRVTRPGGHAFVWALPRTSHWTAWALEDAGWEIRDRVAHIVGSGFPKSKSMREIGRPELGSALKPAVEDWWLVRRPLEESSIARQVLSTGTGALAIDATRVEGKRWPANLLLSHVSGPNGCQRVGTKRVRGNGAFPQGEIKCSATGIPIGSDEFSQTRREMADPDGYEEIESFECAPGCPILELDRQSGITKSIRANRGELDDIRGDNYGRSNGARISGSDSVRGHSDSGGSSRFFTQFHEPDTGPGFLYAPKASRRERTANGRVENTHCTVKNLSLMRWLVRLVTPPDGTVLDCFAGSGTTLLAAIQENVNAIGIEAEEEYCIIAAARISASNDQQELPKPKSVESNVEAELNLLELLKTGGPM